MALSPQSLGRGLATVRYLYELAIQLSRHAGLRRGAAILAFHDAVEMFLVLALQHHDVYTQRRLYHFHEYWGELATADPPVRMTKQSTMETLNRARVNFKHHAIPPDATVVEDARVHVRDFLIENTNIVFDLSFHDISIASALSVFERTRAYLQESESLMASGQYDDALGRIAFAFALLMIDCGATRDPGGSLVSPYEPSTFSSLRLNLDLANRGGPSLPKPITDRLYRSRFPGHQRGISWSGSRDDRPSWCHCAIACRE